MSLSTSLCPTCPSHPSVPKGHMGHQGMSYGVPQHNCLSHHPSVPKGHMGHQGMSYGVPQHSSFVPPVHPIPQSPRDIWDIKGCPMVSLSTVLLSHLSIPSLSPQETYGTSRDVLWCPSAQFFVPPVHPIPQSPRDLWDIKRCSMVSLNTILYSICLSIH